MNPMDEYEKTEFSTTEMDGRPLAHDVYTRGDGPVVLVIQELPGIGPETLRLADKLVNAGFRVVMPHLFGPLGRVAIGGNIARVFCMRREFALFAKNRTSPVVNWLRALARDLRARHNVEGVGVIGMCLTGNFAISMMADDAVLAGVASQPSLPLGASRALHMSDTDIAEIRDALDEKGAMMALRFSGDRICTAAKFEAIGAAFNDDTERVRLVTLPGNGHSVLTLDFVDSEGEPSAQALQDVIAYFGERLNTPEAVPT